MLRTIRLNTHLYRTQPPPPAAGMPMQGAPMGLGAAPVHGVGGVMGGAPPPMMGRGMAPPGMGRGAY